MRESLRSVVYFAFHILLFFLLIQFKVPHFSQHIQLSFFIIFIFRISYKPSNRCQLKIYILYVMQDIYYIFLKFFMCQDEQQMLFINKYLDFGVATDISTKFIGGELVSKCIQREFFYSAVKKDVNLYANNNSQQSAKSEKICNAFCLALKSLLSGFENTMQQQLPLFYSQNNFVILKEILNEYKTSQKKKKNLLSPYQITSNDFNEIAITLRFKSQHLRVISFSKNLKFEMLIDIYQIDYSILRSITTLSLKLYDTSHQIVFLYQHIQLRLKRILMSDDFLDFPLRQGFPLSGCFDLKIVMQLRKMLCQIKHIETLIFKLHGAKMLIFRAMKKQHEIVVFFFLIQLFLLSSQWDKAYDAIFQIQNFYYYFCYFLLCVVASCDTNYCSRNVAQHCSSYKVTFNGGCTYFYIQFNFQTLSDFSCQASLFVKTVILFDCVSNFSAAIQSQLFSASILKIMDLPPIYNITNSFKGVTLLFDFRVSIFEFWNDKLIILIGFIGCRINLRINAFQRINKRINNIILPIVIIGFITNLCNDNSIIYLIKNSWMFVCLHFQQLLHTYYLLFLFYYVKII